MLLLFIGYSKMDKDNSELLRDSKILFAKHGIDVATWLKSMGEENAEFLQMKEDDHQKFCQLVELILQNNNAREDKGKWLEQLVKILFDNGGHGLLETLKNVKTHTNEIDLLIRWTESANSIGANREFRDCGNTFLCECKNYKGKVSVTYIGKFYSLLSCADAHLGILVAWEGITGRSAWSDGSGLIRKIALRDKRYILVLTKDDFLRIYERKTNLFALLNDKYTALKNDIDYSALIQPHELEYEFHSLEETDA